MTYSFYHNQNILFALAVNTLVFGKCDIRIRIDDLSGFEKVCHKIRNKNWKHKMPLVTLLGHNADYVNTNRFSFLSHCPYKQPVERIKETLSIGI